MQPAGVQNYRGFFPATGLAFTFGFTSYPRPTRLAKLQMRPTGATTITKTSNHVIAFYFQLATRSVLVSRPLGRGKHLPSQSPELQKFITYCASTSNTSGCGTPNRGRGGRRRTPIQPIPLIGPLKPSSSWNTYPFPTSLERHRRCRSARRWSRSGRRRFSPRCLVSKPWCWSSTDSNRR